MLRPWVTIVVPAAKSARASKWFTASTGTLWLLTRTDSMAFCQVGEEAIISSAVTPSGRMVKEARS